MMLKPEGVVKCGAPLLAGSPAAGLVQNVDSAQEEPLQNRFPTWNDWNDRGCRGLAIGLNLRPLEARVATGLVDRAGAGAGAYRCAPL